jgi:hypothetical protein
MNMKFIKNELIAYLSSLLYRLFSPNELIILFRNLDMLETNKYVNHIVVPYRSVPYQTVPFRTVIFILTVLRHDHEMVRYGTEFGSIGPNSVYCI